MSEKLKSRKQLFSNPAVQGKILMVSFLSTVLLVGTSWIMSLRAMFTTAKAAAALPVSPAVQNDLIFLFEQQTTVLVIQLIIYSIVSFTLVSLAALLVSHHIGGPLRHFVEYCRGVVKGGTKPAELTFRKNDIPHDVAKAFNEFQLHHGIIKAGSDNEKTPEPPGSELKH